MTLYPMKYPSVFLAALGDILCSHETNIPSSGHCAGLEPTEAERGQVQTLEDTRKHYHLHVTLVTLAPSPDQQALTFISVKL